jgi:hypothetical protein
MHPRAGTGGLRDLLEDLRTDLAPQFDLEPLAAAVAIS